MISEDPPKLRDVEMLRRRSTVFDHLADGVMVTTLEGVIIDWNRGAEEMFGWSREEVMGKTPAILHSDTDAPVLTDSINTTAAKDGRWHGEIEFIRKDGSRGVCETTTTPLRNEAGEIFATLGVNHDITAQKRVEGVIIEEHRVLRTLVDALPDLIFFKDREGRYLLHNKGEQRKWRTTSTEMIGKTVFEIPGVKENAAVYHADDMRVIHTGEPIIAREEPYTTPEGREGWFLTSKYPLRSPQGEIIGLVGIARDITESKETARRLADERERLRTVIDAIPDPLFVKDLNGRHLLNNLANVRAFNLDAYGSLEVTVHELSIPTEHAELYHADDRIVLETGTPVINREEPYLQPDGTRGWFLTSKFPLRDSAGAIVGLVGICRDVTEIKMAAAELEQTRQRLIDHVENSPLGVIEWSADARIERWAGRAEAIFGWTAEEVIGRTFADWEFVVAADLPKVQEQSRRLVEGVDVRNICENRNFRKDGRIIHCLWQNSALRDTEGKILSILSLVEDITERVIAEQKIRDNDRLFHTMVQATNTGYAQLDERGRVLDGNGEFLAMTGRDGIEALRGEALTQCIALHDFDRITRSLQRCLESGTLRNLELEFITPEGRFTPVEINACVLHAGGGRQIIAFCRDISARRAAEAERHGIERKLQEAQKLESLGVLAGGIAHDFNNLLTGVLGNASLAATELPAGSTIMPYLDQIETAAMRAAELCKQMLAYSGKGRFVVQRLDLNAVINETTNLLQISISKNAVLKLTLPPNLPPVIADVTQIRQIVMNLVINASEALAERSGLIGVSTGVVRVDAGYLEATHLSPDLPEGDYVFLEVADNGMGMPPEVQTRIFDPFFTTKFTGRGLGLAAVLGIVRGHKGALKVYSEAGRGTTFKILFPCADGPVDELKAGQPAIAQWRGQGTVLIVDDEETVRATTARMFEVLGFKPLLASSGVAALEIFRQQRAEIVLTIVDLTMPHMEGDEVFREIRRFQPDAKVLLMSGFNEQDAVSRFLGKGLAGFIQKPFRVSSLREKLQQIFGE